MTPASPFVQRQRAFYGLGRFGATATQTGVSTVKGAASGAAAGGSAVAVGAGSALGLGAAAGSVVPIIGTAIGAIAGLVAAGVFNRNDQEVQNFDQALAMWRQNRLSVLNIANKYLVLAGLMDLNIHTNIPFYRKYGRLGEQRFVTDMMNAIYAAANGGFNIPGKGTVTIGPSDTPYTIMSNLVQPWMDSWGYGPMSDPNADMINLILLGMISDYVTHNERTWLARGGDYPFGSLPAFRLPVTAVVNAPSVSSAAPITPISSTSAPAPVAQVGQYITPSSPGTLITPSGTFQYDATTGWLHNGARVGASTEILSIGYNGQQTIALYFNLGSLVWPVGASWWTPLTPPGTYSGVNDPAWITGVAPSSSSATSPPVTATPTSVTPSSTTVSIPAGYTLVGTANGLSAYQGMDGNLYSWNGVSMSLLTGTLLLSSGQSVSVVNGQVQTTGTATTMGVQPLQPLAYPTNSAPSSSDGTPSGTVPIASAGLVPSSSPSWLLYGGIGLAALWMFTKGPLKAKRRRGA